jgi:vacuolar-type H+-ATPase subunit C/Vma6
MLMRFKIENLKVVVRSLVSQVPLPRIARLLVPLPPPLAFKVDEAAYRAPIDFLVRFTPPQMLHKAMVRSMMKLEEPSQLFLLETKLDREFLACLQQRADEVSGRARDEIRQLFAQEIDIFHLLLAIRGGQHYKLKQELLFPFHIKGTRIAASHFAAMLSAGDIPTLVSRCPQLVFDSPGAYDPALEFSSPEREAWKRYLRLANRTYRRDHMGLGVIIGYLGLRRIESANIITLTEGIRQGLPAQTIRLRLITGITVEEKHAF